MPTFGSANAGTRSFSQSCGPHRVIGIDDADDVGICCRVCKREPQRARFVSGDIIRIDELETFTERAAMIPTGRQNVGSGVLLMTTTHSKFG